jgi:RNA polymerase sigma factor (TIGR02999 family)
VGEVDRALERVASGEPRSSERLLVLVYDELRRLAAGFLERERPGQTLQPTALVHEAYLRLVDPANPAQWNSRGHFFGAAAQAMRRVLVERARRKGREKHGGGRERLDVELTDVAEPVRSDDLIALDEAIEELAREDAESSRVVTMRYFGGMTADEIADVTGVSRATVQRRWTYARAWLHLRLRGPGGAGA